MRELNEYIESRSIPIPECGCWVWTGKKNRDGYGVIEGKFGHIFGGTTCLAHRLSFFASHGNIPHGLQILHSCDTPSCVNPSHLRAGTHADNMRDKVIRNRCRGRGVRGEENSGAKITDGDVRAIRQSRESQRVLARRYGLYQSSISRIRSRKEWSHVADFAND